MSAFTPEKIESDRRILELLSQNFGNISAAATEIINLEAILNLPKGTEHFIAIFIARQRHSSIFSKTHQGILKEKSTNFSLQACARKISDNFVR